MTSDEQLGRLRLRLAEIAPRAGDSVQKMRDDHVAAIATVPIADGVDVDSLTFGDKAVELLTPEEHLLSRTLLYLHGGGYTIGSAQTTRPLASQLGVALRARVYVPDYRLAPESPFPAAVNDVVEVYGSLLELGIRPSSIIVAGDSAGGGLAISAAVALRDRNIELPAGLVCLSPWCDLSLSARSLDAAQGKDPMISRSLLAGMAAHYLDGASAEEPLASPLYADLRGLPPMLIHAGGAEGLLEDSTRLATRAREAGVEVTCTCWERMFHVWHAFAPRLSEAVEAIDQITVWVAARTSA
jgi:monoterpene epsilon-lactone hydrolase